MGRVIEATSGICDSCGTQSDSIYYVGAMEGWCQSCIDDVYCNEDDDLDSSKISVATLAPTSSVRIQMTNGLSEAWEIAEEISADRMWVAADLYHYQTELAQLDSYNFECCAGTVLEGRLVLVECETSSDKCPAQDHWHTPDMPYVSSVAYDLLVAFIEHTDHCTTTQHAA